jgi:hypothetical protein
MHIIDIQKLDIESLLTIAKPRLEEAYKNGNSKQYHKVSKEFIPLAIRVFEPLYKNSEISWLAGNAYGSRLYDSSFWHGTDLVHSFCNYLDLKFKETNFN